MSPQEIPAEVKSCKAITDDKERLKCFDGLFGSTSQAPKSSRRSTRQTGLSMRPNRQLMAVPRWSRRI